MDPSTSKPASATQSTIAGQAAAVIQGNNAEDQSAFTQTPSRRASEIPPTPGEVPPPTYGEQYGKVQGNQDGFGTEASVGEDGRVNIKITQRHDKLSKIFGSALHRQQTAVEHETVPPPAYIPPSLGGGEGVAPPPPMNVVIQVVGSRGDVQPFIALGKVLKETYGHRVRLATHPNFEQFVEENGLEFFSIGGDPAQLMAFMVKHPGLMPDFDALRTGDIGKRRKEVAEYIKGCWRSCFETGNGRGVEVSDDSIQDWTTDENNSAQPVLRPFVADCIIANPPSFAHVHCAERLAIPLHIMFTMPYSPTQAFPHPLANIQSSNADPRLTNYVSYALIEMLTWQGLGDIINRFRAKSLGLEPVSLVRAPGMLQRLQIPHTYCWSPALIPKPADWPQRVSISGFYFLNLATNYVPPTDLSDFLQSGPPPVYIGFGSIVLDDPNAMTELIFDTVRKSGQRVLLSKGWGGMGAHEMSKPDGVFMLGNCPHDWLFKHVSCVVHHGGAGTTAAGITAGRPTVVVPFFGDQPFWGAMVARAGAGPEPIPHKQLTSDKLAEAIEFCLRPESQERAKELAQKIASETGTQSGAQSFHQFLDVDTLRCNLVPSKVAVWRLKRTQVRISAMAACTLAQANLLSFNDLKLFRAKEYEADDGPWEPISGATTALVGTMSTMMLGVADLPIDTLKALRIHPDSLRKTKKATPTAGPSEEGSARSDGATPVVSGRSSPQPPSPAVTTDLQSSAASGLSTPRNSNDAASTTASSFNFQESLAKFNSPLASPVTEGVPSSSTREPIASSMAEALRGQLGRPRSRSNSRSRSSSNANGKSLDNIMDTALGTSKGVGRIIGAGLSSPIDFTMGLSKGFHNAPRLYGDETVRKHDPVTDFRSGVKAAGKEFGLGMYDGISGLVTQPLRGAQKDGAAGFVKGIGKGIGGIALKPGAAIFGIPAYTMKGVQKEIQRYFGSSVQNYIIASRTAQGYAEWRSSSQEERDNIIQRWKGMQRDIKKKRNPDEMVRDILEEQRRKHSERLAECREQRRSRSGTVNSQRSSSSTVDSQRTVSQANFVHSAQTPTAADIGDDDLEEAIRRSVQETSRGNPDEDAEVERAIQASIADLKRQRRGQPEAEPYEDEDEDLQRAIRASEAEAHGNLLYDSELEHVIAQSLREQRKHCGDEPGWDASEAQSAGLPGYGESSQDLGHMQGTTRQEHDLRGGGAEKTLQERTEEQIVLEYVKKQSLLEEEHRRKVIEKQSGA